MNYFNFLSSDRINHLFFRPPVCFDKRTGRDLLRYAVGGLLYIPATDRRIAQIITDGKIPALSSMAVCLEDAVGDGNRQDCVRNVMEQFALLSQACENGSLPPDRLPLLFVRVKDADMLEEMADFFVRRSDVITGVILPKVTGGDLERALSIVKDVNSRSCQPFYAMPILESRETAVSLQRVSLLEELRRIADRFAGLILNIRIGATDLCGLYGIRRRADTPIYSIGVAASCIADIVRVFGLDDRYTISGPVWEYFNAGGMGRELEGLWTEASLDLQNGLLGKTCVHPSQLPVAQAAYAVPYELYQDAMGVLSGDCAESGVISSESKNKMNELKPHALWARKIQKQADIYGVYREGLDRAAMLRTLYGKETIL